MQGITDEYNDVKLFVFRDPTFTLDAIQSTMRNIYFDEQSRKGSKGRVAGRGFAMTTAASDFYCHYCKKSGHIKRSRPKLRNKKKERPAGAAKWCSKHNSTTHSDEECYQQRAKRPERSKEPAKASTTCAHFLGEEGQAGPLDLRRVDHLHLVHAIRRGLHRRAAVDRHRGGAEWPQQALGGGRSVDVAAMCRGL